jgi:MoaA/NifB/PqqE/SkfB family radical SAM enzyme
MHLQSQLLRLIRPALRRFPSVKNGLVSLDLALTRQRHEWAKQFPVLIKPEPRLLQVAITANCNLRCLGCRYGRDFMPGKSLPLPIVVTLLEDAKEAGFLTVRLYGGEPLLHRDLPEMVRVACRVGLMPCITTNAILLGEKIDTLFDAGLRTATIGFYGDEHTYDPYVQRSGAYSKVERSIAKVRDRYGKDVRLQINFLLSRLSCNLESLRTALRFAERYETNLQVDIVHYSLPYFTEGPDRELQFVPSDEAGLYSVVQELLEFRQRRPELYTEPDAGIRSIPDWALKGPAMRIPCNAYRMIWVGADGTVQLCYVTFKLGNLHEKRLRDMMFTAEHRQAARDGFALNCPNCHCQRYERIETDKTARRLYSINPVIGEPRRSRPACVPTIENV